MTKRIAIFAAYSKTGIIEDYVLYYLQGLRKVVDTIVYVSDNTTTFSEQNKLQGLVEHFIFLRHKEYDFGSYKRGFNYAKENALLAEVDELILCNDSCFGPIFPFSESFLLMQEKQTDFWGITESIEIIPHLQSYFMVFKKQVFESAIFSDYLNKVKRKFNFMTVVKSYEVPFTKYLVSKGGFSYSSYLFFQKEKKNPTFYINTLLKQRCPLIKRKAFVDKKYAQESLEEFLQELKIFNIQGYNLISKYVQKHQL